MNYTNHLIACLAEECGEVAKECMKSLRFGLDDKVTRDPKGPRGTEGPTNAEKIVAELNDLLGVVRLLTAHGAIPSNWQDAAAQDAKAVKVLSYMGYAESIGALGKEAQ